MATRIPLVLAMLCVFASTALAQLTNAQIATVYVYMPHHATTTWRFSGKFYVDEKRTVEISKNRYFVLRLPSGKHSFYVRDKKLGGLELNLTAGETYYLKVNVDEGGYRIRFRGVSSVPKEEAEFVIRQIQPIKKGDIFDKTFGDQSVVSP